MGETSARVFGRRQGEGQRAADGLPLRSSSDAVLPRPVADETVPRQHVPRSRRAALIAGLVVGCLYMSVGLRDGNAAHLPQIAGLVVPGVDPKIALSAVAAGGLLAGLRGAMGSLLVVRIALNAMRLTDFVAYALAGGALATLDGLAMRVLGIALPALGLGFVALAGAATAALFRLFAGVKRT